MPREIAARDAVGTLPVQMNLPLLFNFQQFILGNGFIANVQMTGRAILTDEDGEVWIAGVAPAGVAGGGPDRASAFTEFRKAWGEILFDIARDAKGYGDFQLNALEFLHSRVGQLDADWSAALKEVRASDYEDPGLPKADERQHPVRFAVSEMQPQQATADQNQAERGLHAAA